MGSEGCLRLVPTLEPMLFASAQTSSDLNSRHLGLWNNVIYCEVVDCTRLHLLDNRCEMRTYNLVRKLAQLMSSVPTCLCWLELLGAIIVAGS
jgi:hypothetical protein